MNYKNIYDRLIENVKKLNRKKSKEIYYECHHIKPRCIGGLDDRDNLVLLTAMEHLTSHELLTKMYPNNPKIFYAYWMLCNKTDHKPDDYCKLKERMSKLSSIRSKKYWSDEQNRKRKSKQMKEYMKNNPVSVQKWHEKAIKYIKSERGRNISRETANRMWSKDENRKKISDKMIEYWTDDKKKEQSIKLKNFYNENPDHKKKCVHYRKVNIDGIEYNGVEEARVELNLSTYTINKRLRSKEFPNYKYYTNWKYSHKSKSVVIGGTTYNTMAEAREDLRIGSHTLRCRLNSDQYPEYRYLV